MKGGLLGEIVEGFDSVPEVRLAGPQESDLWNWLCVLF
jgi:hypothetical protein